ncbi:MAG: HEAT repeat domain-containing protein, partial [Chloroflexota bacterium]
SRSLARRQCCRWSSNWSSKHQNMEGGRLISDLFDEAKKVSKPLRKRIRNQMVPTLLNADVTTYSALYQLIHNADAPKELRLTACNAVNILNDLVDHHQATEALLTALTQEGVDTKLRYDAISSLTRIKSRRAIPMIVDILADKSEDPSLRIWIVNQLYAWDEIPELREIVLNIIYDETENPGVRGELIEKQHHLFVTDDDIGHLVYLLNNPEPVVRFWAAYAINGGRIGLTAIPYLDRIAATDTTVPDYSCRWHVGREALMVLDGLTCGINETGGLPYLLSPTLEFLRFEKAEQAVAVPSLSIDAQWLREELAKRWPRIVFDVRPGLTTYVLDWRVDIEGEVLFGGLHCDRYAITITGLSDAVASFAFHISTLFPDEDWWLYQWLWAECDLGQFATSDLLHAELLSH